MSDLIRVTIPYRWLDYPVWSGHIAAAADATPARRLGLAAVAAIADGADLTGADLSGAKLTRADLTDADMSSAKLTGADLTGAKLTGAKLPPAPVIPDIHRAIYAAASAPGALEMLCWHACETTHCRAGWAVKLAGRKGKALEDALGGPGAGTNAAAALIYMASDPTLERVPNWFATNADALADMRRLAGVETGDE